MRRTNLFRVLLLSTVHCLLSTFAAAQPKPFTVDDLAFLAGKWVGGEGDVVFEEQWSEPLGNSMIGMFRVIVRGKPQLYELLSLEQEQRGPVLRLKHFSPGEGLVSREERDQAVTLPLVSFSGGEVVFAGTNNGKPLRIIYRRDGNDLYSAVEKEKDGKMSREEFRFSRPEVPEDDDAPSTQRFEDALLDKMVGRWTLTGTVMGEPANQNVDASWVLNHQFLRIHFTDRQQPPDYEAIAYVGYDHRSDRYVAHWLDVFGGRFSETLGYGTRDGNSIRFVFEYPDGPFHNTFTWDPTTNAWRFLLRTKNKRGEWVTFAEETMTRAR